MARCLFALGALCAASSAEDLSSACLSSIRVRDGFISETEAASLLRDFEGTDCPQVLRGHANVQLRLKEALAGEPKINPLFNFIPGVRKSGNRVMHQDHGELGGLRGSQYGKVNGTSATLYLESAPDRSSLGWMTFMAPGVGSSVKQVEAFAGRFLSWDNRFCLHGFIARGDGHRRLLGPMALDADGELVGVAGESDLEVTPDTTTPRPSPEPKSCKPWCFLLKPKLKLWAIIPDCQGPQQAMLFS
ncbi:unnamed protein product [Symbiodinium natans]|uniref:PPIase cyclophilin-type domain-containing protein n=1 Tax=Symbiodinium natans TaxID=878477 RepID=A0A812GPL9_9DINO|nr:unnamed protein product [Symbiodinium natans]